MQKPYSSYKNERSFGNIFAIIFILIGLYFIFVLDQTKIIFFIVSLIFLSISFIAPKIFFYPNKLWMSFGYYLGLITTPIFISLIYIVVVIPTGLILKMFGKDVLDRKVNLRQISNWKKRSSPGTELEKQF